MTARFCYWTGFSAAAATDILANIVPHTESVMAELILRILDGIARIF